MFARPIPVLRVRSSTQAEAFYCGELGFRQDFAMRIDEPRPDPCYMGIQRDEARLHLSSFPGDGAFGGIVFFPVRDLDVLREELRSAHVPVDLEPTEQTWGNREMYVRDPDGNSLRFVQIR